MRVFVATTTYDLNVLTIFHALGPMGISLTVGSANYQPTTQWSRYCRGHVRYPSPSTSPDEFCAFLMDFLKREPHDVLIPADDPTAVAVSRRRDDLQRLVRCPFPDGKLVMLALDKGSSTGIVQDMGIPTARTWQPTDPDELEKMIPSISLPALIKPRTNSGSWGIVKVGSARELRAMYVKVHRRFPSPIIQEFIPKGGKKYLVGALFNRQGAPRAAIVHLVHRQVPMDGGRGTFFESVKAPDVMEMGLKILKALNWYGVACLEFLEDPRDGSIKFLEINPRFWGQLLLSIHAGINFPLMLVMMSIQGDVEENFEYREGVSCQFFLYGDFLHFIKNPERFRSLSSYFRFWSKDTSDLCLFNADMLPLVGYFLTNPFNVLRRVWRGSAYAG